MSAETTARFIVAGENATSSTSAPNVTLEQKYRLNSGVTSRRWENEIDWAATCRFVIRRQARMIAVTQNSIWWRSQCAFDRRPCFGWHPMSQSNTKLLSHVGCPGGGQIWTEGDHPLCRAPAIEGCLPRLLRQLCPPHKLGNPLGKVPEDPPREFKVRAMTYYL